MESDLSFAAIDFETANYHRYSACAVGLVKVERGKIVAAEHRLINPDTYFIRDFYPIHGITAADVADEPFFDQVWQELQPLLEGASFIAAHNAPFDRSVLKACCNRYKILPPALDFVCTVRKARQVWNIRPTTLDNVCRYLRINLNHHHALSDALACA